MGYLTSLRKVTTAEKLWSEDLKFGDRLEYVNIDGNIIFRWILKEQRYGLLTILEQLNHY
jgi:hypothetical protein